MTEDHALSGAYAVDALDDTERARFEDHLRRCAECRVEVDGLREAAAHLELEAVAPSAAMRDAVLAGIREIRPLPPIVPEDDDREGRDELAARRDRRSGTRLAARLPLLVAAAAVLIAGAAGTVLKPWAEDERPPSVNPPGITAEDIIAASDATRVEKRFPDGAEAVVTVSRAKGGAVIQTDDMRNAPDGRDYQLWLQTPAGVMEPAGIMPDTRDATVLLDGDASRAKAVGITVEPDGGSERPTSEPIAVFNLDS